MKIMIIKLGHNSQVGVLWSVGCIDSDCYVRFRCLWKGGTVGCSGKFVKLSRLWKIYDNFRIMASDMQVDDDAMYSID